MSHQENGVSCSGNVPVSFDDTTPQNKNIKSTTCDPPNLTRSKEQSIKDSEQTTIDEKTHTPIIQNM